MFPLLDNRAIPLSLVIQTLSSIVEPIQNQEGTDYNYYVPIQITDYDVLLYPWSPCLMSPYS